MITEQIFKKIYQDLKSELTNNTDSTFLKEYIIPSINYNTNKDGIENMYFASGIEMELYRMMEQLENKIYFVSYKDKYFFSNDSGKLQKRLVLEIANQENLETELEM